jgi:hypothetical protein
MAGAARKHTRDILERIVEAVLHPVTTAIYIQSRQLESYNHQPSSMGEIGASALSESS